VLESLHEQTDEELTETDIKRMDADDQAIQTILLGLLENVYAAVDSCETVKEIWELVRQMMKVRQTKNLHEADFTQIYDFLKMNHEENVRGNGRNQFGQYAGQVHRISKGLMYGRMGLQTIVELVMLLLLGLRVLELGIKPDSVVIAQKEEAGIQLQAEEFDFMAAAGDLDEIEEVNANCILMANLQQASTSGTQHYRAPVYDTDGLAKVHLNDNCYDNKIFNMFTQEEQYTDLLKPILKPELVLQNDNHVTSVALSMVHSGGTVETSSSPNKEIRTHQETVYRNLVDQVAQ
nr:hypothetical protein [Tanacetum cinerariifolium]